MNKATEAAMALKKVIDDLSQLVTVVMVTGTNKETVVVVHTERDLEQIPGEAEKIHRASLDFPVELRKVHAGVTFKCLLEVRRTA